MTEAIQRFRDAIRIPTISDPAATNTDELCRFQRFLAESFPRVFATLRVEYVSPYSIILEWPGSDPTRKPILLLAHYDVVPAANEGWIQPPFSGALAEGYIWGRGTLDSKCTVTGSLEAIDRCLADGYTPETSVFLALNGDEELSGTSGALRSAGLFAERGISFAWLLDEGTAVVRGVLPGVDRPVALIGTAEKGYADITLTVAGTGGHAAFPPAESATNILVRACERIDRRRFASRMTRTARGFIKAISSGTTGIRRFVTSNPGVFRHLIIGEFSKAPNTDALFRTTQALTLLSGSPKSNVIPEGASATYNLRILPGESVAGCVDEFVRRIDDHRVAVTPNPGAREPSAESSTDSAGFRAIASSLERLVPEAIVAPFLATVTTDSGHYRNVTDDTYRLFPTILDGEAIASLHGINEKISIEGYRMIIDFYTELLHAI